MTRGASLSNTASRVKLSVATLLAQFGDRGMNREALAWVLAAGFGISALVLYLQADEPVTQQGPPEVVSTPATGPSPEQLEAEQDRQRALEREQEQALQELNRQLQEVRKQLQNTVAKCAASVRAGTNKRFGREVSSFDAFVPDEGKATVSYFGSSAERFQFEKCMAKSGHALDGGSR